MSFVCAFDSLGKYDERELILDNAQIIIIILERETHASIDRVCSLAGENKELARISPVIESP